MLKRSAFSHVALLLAGAGLLSSIALLTPSHAQPSGGRLAAVKAKGSVRCGVNPGLAGFAFPDSTGQWRGLDVDVCRAVAAAVFGERAPVPGGP